MCFKSMNFFIDYKLKNYYFYLIKYRVNRDIYELLN